MTRRPFKLNETSWIIVISALALCAIGLMTIYGFELGLGGAVIFTSKQAVFIGLGCLLAAVTIRVGYARIAPHAYVLSLMGVLLLIPLLVARVTGWDFGGLVPEIRKSHRWIQIPGLQLQPSEIVKITYLLGLAHYLRYRKNFRTFWGLLIPFIFTLIPLALILLQPDLGTSLLLMPMLFVMIFAAGARVKHLAIIVALALAATPFLWDQIKPYQRARVMAFLMQSDSLRQKIAEQPDRYRFTGVDRKEALRWERSSGMQLVFGKTALGSGGLWGQGMGEGTYVEYSFLPDRHNDFIFAIVGHQFGLVGCSFLLLSILVLILAGLSAATSTTEPEGRLIAIGVVSLLGAQTVINVGMTVGLMPITGMTLPFVSYGGTSLLVNSLAIGLLISVAQTRPFLLAPKPFEFHDDV